jgi:hypothetical protein
MVAASVWLVDIGAGAPHPSLGANRRAQMQVIITGCPGHV